MVRLLQVNDFKVSIYGLLMKLLILCLPNKKSIIYDFSVVLEFQS